MAVTSRDLSQEERKPGPTRLVRFGGAPEIGIGLLVYFLFAWLAGARFTVDGGILFVNWFLDWLTVPARLAPLNGWRLALGAVIVGAIVSRAEIARFPWRITSAEERRVILFLGVGALFGWALFVGLDVYTTYAGLTTLPPNAWPVHRWTAATPWAAGLASAWLTFTPELALLAALYLIGWRPPRWLR